MTNLEAFCRSFSVRSWTSLGWPLSAVPLTIVLGGERAMHAGWVAAFVLWCMMGLATLPFWLGVYKCEDQT